MAAIMDCLKSAIENIIKKLGMWHVVLMLVAHHSMKEKLQQCVNICTRLKNKHQDDLSVMSCVVTCNEMWAYHHRPKTKKENAAWRTLGSSLWQKICKAKPVGKVMLIFFSWRMWNHYWHVVPSTSQGQKQTANSEYYYEVLKTLFTQITKKKTEFWSNSFSTSVARFFFSEKRRFQ